MLLNIDPDLLLIKHEKLGLFLKNQAVFYYASKIFN